MNKKLSTLIFILSGTILNIILMIIFIFGLLAGGNALLRGLGYEPHQPIYIPFLIGSIFGGVILSFIVYSKITKYVQKKFDLDKFITPLFKSKKR